VCCTRLQPNTRCRCMPNGRRTHRLCFWWNCQQASHQSSPSGPSRQRGVTALAQWSHAFSNSDVSNATNHRNRRIMDEVMQSDIDNRRLHNATHKLELHVACKQQQNKIKSTNSQPTVTTPSSRARWKAAISRTRTLALISRYLHDGNMCVVAGVYVYVDAG